MLAEVFIQTIDIFLNDTYAYDDMEAVKLYIKVNLGIMNQEEAM
jgi:hypothetical protein